MLWGRKNGLICVAFPLPTHVKSDSAACLPIFKDVMEFSCWSGHIPPKAFNAKDLNSNDDGF